MGSKTVAVLGAGIQGACAALALAARGCRVELFDQASQAVTQASRWNEGKIHLGFVYAKDASHRTADIMVRGALHFDSALRRLTGRNRAEWLLSSPFRYVVHRTSQLPADAIAAHFDRVASLLHVVRAASGLSYFGHRSDFVWERMSGRELRAEYDADEAVAAFRTIERSVDPGSVAEVLRRAIDEHNGIQFRPRHRVEGVLIDSSGAPRVVVADEGALGPYDHVVNALWQDRLRVDATVGLRPDRPWLHRYKTAIHVSDSRGPPLPSTTILLGEYGDVVDFGGGRRYLSWYPACKLGQWPDLRPPDVMPMIDDMRRQQTLDTTIGALSKIIPAVGALDLSQAKVDMQGGFIFAWGSTDISDRESELHARCDIGIRSLGRYHSIDTGKYGMAPYFADQLADRICGEASSGPCLLRQPSTL